ncbi:MAG TPA: RidA family protein [Acidimicrobiia bacterium]|nr:RidA family protein [Acidimicrobiia bacterium]
MSRHHLFDPEGLPAATGFSYGALAAEGRTLHIAGMTGTRSDGSLPETLIEQFSVACQGVATVITEGGGGPTDLVSMTIYTTDIERYRSELRELGLVYREVFGRHYPPMALIGVSRLFDPAILVELVCVAVVPGVDPG